MTAKSVRYLAAVPVVPVRDIGEAVTFYTQRLGAELAFEQGPYAGVRFGAVELHLDGVVNEGAGKVTARVHVEGVDALFDTLEANGVIDPAEPLNTKPWGARQFSALDGCGNRITFVQLARG
jgi:uncharacterized glyoxalase superfamily protein PhnB